MSPNFTQTESLIAYNCSFYFYVYTFFTILFFVKKEAGIPASLISLFPLK